MKTIFSERKAIGIILLVLVAGVVCSYIVMSIWNTVLVTVIPAIHAITMGQAFWIMVLCKILFGSHFRGGGWKGRGGPWGAKMREKWGAMTPEEQDKFRQNWRSRCGRKGMPKDENSGQEAGADI